MAMIIEPKVNVVDYGPKILDENGNVIISPDDFVYGAAGIAYKDVGALREVIDLRMSEADVNTRIRDSLINSAGAGHASMATTPGLWVFLEGNCSKLVDSLFTGARFASALMPSGRRVPIAKDQIVIPRNVANRPEAEKIYTRTIENCIDVYEELQKRGVEKQEASKIVPYGHRGGGFMFMPLETLVAFSRDFEENADSIPREGIEVVRQLTDFVKSHGMGITYESRRNAPRTSAPNPGIFHTTKNLVQEVMDENRKHVLDNPILLNLNFIPNEEFFSRIDKFVNTRNCIFQDTERIKDEWKYLLAELGGIVEDYNNSITATTVANTPWRVWGEVKRHRTLPQVSESIYNAIGRAMEVKDIMPSRTDNQVSYEDWQKVFSVPSAVKERENFNLWINTFRNSLEVYRKLINMEVAGSDAVGVIPRGIKFGVLKQWDLYNMTTGMMSLRLCTTVEPEMRKITAQERDLIIRYIDNPSLKKCMNNLIIPKCGYIGFCTDKNCGVIKSYVPSYDDEFHKQFRKERKNEILENL